MCNAAGMPVEDDRGAFVHGLRPAEDEARVLFARHLFELRELADVAERQERAAGVPATGDVLLRRRDACGDHLLLQQAQREVGLLWVLPPCRPAAIALSECARRRPLDRRRLLGNRGDQLLVQRFRRQLALGALALVRQRLRRARRLRSTLEAFGGWFLVVQVDVLLGGDGRGHLRWYVGWRHARVRTDGLRDSGCSRRFVPGCARPVACLDRVDRSRGCVCRVRLVCAFTRAGRNSRRKRQQPGRCTEAEQQRNRQPPAHARYLTGSGSP